MNIYYVYAYLREKDSPIAKSGTPYYIGKGKGNRLYKPHRIPIPENKNNIIVIAHKLFEHEAFLLEIRLIAKYGRVNMGTGILRNLTDGGEGTSGKIVSPEVAARISAAKTEWHKTHDVSGPNNGMFGRTHSSKVRLDSKIRAQKHGFIGNRKGKAPWNKGKSNHLTSEQRDKISASRLLTPKKICPHCGKEVAPHILSRFHGDKCPLSPDNNLVS